MKRFLSFSILLIFFVGNLSAQKYSNSDFIGTWTVENSDFTLKRDHTVKVNWYDGTTSSGTWKYDGLGSYFNTLTLDFSFGTRELDILNVTNYTMSLRNTENGSRIDLKKTRSSTDTEIAAAAGAVLFTAALLYLLSGDSDDGGSSYSPCSVCGGSGVVLSSNCPSGCTCPGCGG